jgi:predicted GTPase
LWIDDLDPDGKILEAVITTLIYGVKSVSAQSEFALSELADYIRKENPELALFLILSRYVDDLLDSKSSRQECEELAKAADELFGKVGLKCKA